MTRSTALVVSAGIFLSSAFAHATDLQTFLKNCGYGTLIGVGAGVVSLALTDKPSDNTSNIAKGASLGLYGGIAYGIYKLNQPVLAPQQIVDPYATIQPVLKDGQIEGAHIFVQFASFR